MGFKFFSAQPAHEVVGYVVGMDDYHWMLATRSQGGEGIVTPVLIHKQADAVVLHPDETLSTEPEDFRSRVESIGKSYWDRLKSQNKEENANNGNA